MNLHYEVAKCNTAQQLRLDGDMVIATDSSHCMHGRCELVAEMQFW